MNLWNHFFYFVFVLLTRRAVAYISLENTNTTAANTTTTNTTELRLNPENLLHPSENEPTLGSSKNLSERSNKPVFFITGISNKGDGCYEMQSSGCIVRLPEDIENQPLTKLPTEKGRIASSQVENANLDQYCEEDNCVSTQDGWVPQKPSFSLDLEPEIAASKQPLPKFKLLKPPYGRNIKDDLEHHFFLEHYEEEIKMMQKGKGLDWMKKGLLLRLSPRDSSTVTIAYAVLASLEAHLQIFNGVSVSLSQADFQYCAIGDLTILKEEAVTLTRLAEHGAKASLCEYTKKFNTLKKVACNERELCQKFPTVRPIVGTAGFANKFELMRQLKEHGPVATTFTFTVAMEGFLEARKEKKKKKDYIFRPDEHWKYASNRGSVFSKYIGKLMGGVLVGFGYTRHHISFKLLLSLPELGSDQIVKVREDAVYFESMISFSEVILTPN